MDLAENVQVCFREHRLLREALVELISASRPYLEPGGYPYAHPAMARAREVLNKTPPTLRSAIQGAPR